MPIEDITIVEFDVVITNTTVAIVDRDGADFVQKYDAGMPGWVRFASRVLGWPVGRVNSRTDLQERSFG